MSAPAEGEFGHRPTVSRGQINELMERARLMGASPDDITNALAEFTIVEPKVMAVRPHTMVRAAGMATAARLRSFYRPASAENGKLVEQIYRRMEQGR